METDQSNKKQKKKFVPISEIDNALLPGRHECDCEASVHELICNCLNCGRVVCEQENVGPCFTCGENVITKKELEEIIRRTKEFAERKQKNAKIKKLETKSNVPMNLKEIASSLIGIEKATEHKDQLLEFERTSEKRTKVIDDELDYFDLTKENWLSNEKREELREKVEKLHEDKFEIDRRYEMDFNTRQVVEVCIPKVKDLNDEVNKLKEQTGFKSDYEIVDFKQILANEPELEPYYVETTNDKRNNKQLKNKSNKNQKSNKSSNKNILPNISLIRDRLQNSELFDTVDEGYALSINQPWASLLIHQIKLHEGRSWFTTHRGPLWIHASAKSPRKEEIEEACSLFRLMLDENIQFPSNYPLGCIIGRVNLVECLEQKEYQAKFGNSGYLDDPYVFIFNDAIKLKADVPCSGRAKIYKLEKSIFKVLSSQILPTYGSINKSSH